MDVDDVPIAGSVRTNYWATIKPAPGQSDTQFSGTALTDLNTPDLDVDSWDDNGVLYIYGPTGLVMEFNRYHCSTLLFDPQGSCSVSSNGIVQGSWYTTAPNYSLTLYDGYGNLVWTAS